VSLDFYLQYIDEDTFETSEIYSRNITHNLTGMWNKAGIYDSLYNSHRMRPKEIIGLLRSGLAHMEDNPAEYRLLEPENGWGSYENALEFLRDVIAICSRYPNATIGISK